MVDSSRTGIEWLMWLNWSVQQFKSTEEGCTLHLPSVKKTLDDPLLGSLTAIDPPRELIGGTNVVSTIELPKKG